MSEDAAGDESVSAAPEDRLRNVNGAMILSRCPICRARLAENTSCPRCGSDLSLLVQIAHDAIELERVAVAHLLRGEWAKAKAVLNDVQRLRRGEWSARMLAFVEHQMLASTRLPDTPPHSDAHEIERGSLASLDLSNIERYG